MSNSSGYTFGSNWGSTGQYLGYTGGSLHNSNQGQIPYQSSPSQGGANTWQARGQQSPPGGTSASGSAYPSPSNVAQGGWMGSGLNQQRTSVPGSGSGVAPWFPGYSQQRSQNYPSRISDSDLQSRHSNPSSGNGSYGRGYTHPHGYVHPSPMPYGMPVETSQLPLQALAAFANDVPAGPGMLIPGGGRRIPPPPVSDVPSSRSAGASSDNRYPLGRLSFQPDSLIDIIKICPRCNRLIVVTDERNHTCRSE